MSAEASPEYTEKFADVEKAETEWIRARRVAAADGAADSPLVGLSIASVLVSATLAVIFDR